MKDENEIEDLFKEKFEDFEPEVDSKVWKNVKTGIKVAGAGVIGNFLINKLGTNAIIAIVSSIVTLIGTVTVMNWTGADEKDKELVENTIKEAPIKVKSPEQLTPEEIKEFLHTGEGVAPKENKTETDLIPPVANTSKAIKPKEIANIQASTTSGVAPLIVDISNAGKGKKNTWTLGEKVNNNESPAYFFDVPGVYIIKLLSVNSEGQSQRDSVKIEVLAKSEVDVASKISFTPNGDGKNDFFAVNPLNVVKLDAEIFDKQGNLIYKWSGIDGKWDGKNMKGEPAKTDTYYFVLKYEDASGVKSENKGTVKLIR